MTDSVEIRSLAELADELADVQEHTRLVESECARLREEMARDRATLAKLRNPDPELNLDASIMRDELIELCARDSILVVTARGLGGTLADRGNRLVSEARRLAADVEDALARGRSVRRHERVNGAGVTPGWQRKGPQGSPENYAIRTWAREQGMYVPSQGRISGAIREAYAKAHP